MELHQVQRLFERFVQEAEGRLTDALCEIPSEQPLREAIESYLRDHQYPEPSFYDIASTVYHFQGEYSRVEEMLDRWKRSKGNPIIPVIRHALLFFSDRYIGYEECLEQIQEGLQREPENPLLLAIAYQAAVEKKDPGRRLYYAGRMAAVSVEPDQHLAYGVECGKNLMVDRAQAAFEKAHELDSRDVRALNGLGKCRLERLELDEAEELFQQSLALKATAFAKKALAMIQRLRHGKAWSDEEKRLEKFWAEWADDQLAEMNAAEQGRLLAECFAVCER